MGSPSSKLERSQWLKHKLRRLPFEPPTERDFEFLSYQTGIEKDQIREKFEKFLETHPDGRMNRREYADLYQSLRTDSPEKYLGLLEIIFRALGIEDLEADLLTLKEFFITFALTGLGDFNKKLEYVFDIYDSNRDNALDINEAKEAIYAMLELFNVPKERTVMDITNDCIRDMKPTYIVKKEDFVEGLPQNKDFLNIVTIFK